MRLIQDNDGPVIALTFDDGPNTVTTVKVLDKLEKYDVRATFFVVGQNVNGTTAEVIRRACRMGCEIQNHSMTHRDMSMMQIDGVMAEIVETSNRIAAITGKQTDYFRPPYYAYNQSMLDAVPMPFILGYGAEDWEDKVSAGERAERIISQAKDGAIMLLHDMENNDQTVEALDLIIPKLLSEGYHFVTIPELFLCKSFDIAGAAGKTFYSVDGSV